MTPRHQVSDFPAIIEIELTTRCNQNCRVCQRYWLDHIKQRPDLDFKLLDRVLDDIGQREAQVNLGGLGESFLVPELPTFLSHIKRRAPQVKTGVNTNGLLLEPDTWEWLTDGRLDFFTISLNAPDSESYSRLIGSDDFHIVTQNAGLFLRHKGFGQKPYTTIHVFDLPSFQSQMKQYEQTWRGIADHVQMRPLSNWGGFVPLEDFGIKPQTSGICERPWTSIAIDTGGGLHRCCACFQKESPLARLDNTTIVDYWRGETIKEFRRRMSEQNLDDEICRKCNAKILRPNTFVEQEHLEWTKHKPDSRIVKDVATGGGAL